MTRAAALELRGVVKEYGQYAETVRALRGIDLVIEAGELVAVVGASGSGKSTLLHMMGLLDKPTRGEVLVGGVPTTRMGRSEAARFRGRKLGYIFQGYNLIPRLTALENVLLPGTFAGGDRDALDRRARELLRLVGLGHRLDHRAVHLSGGEQQRAAIARALVHDPVLILADEPTGALDSTASRKVMEILARLNEERGATLVFVTHDLGVAAHGRRLVRLADGAVVEDAPAAKVVAGG
ncbi:MAG TPA: ABC transporter ATP-binding protein [Candidatus Thermoplasmatota archaeon]|nr:ABC transporter ATP-binding protein [Candidatus Thermoplasmatota archaeon]